MTRYIFLFFFLGVCFVAHGQLYIESNAVVTVKSGEIALQNIDLINNGVLNAEGGSFWFQGLSDQQISGTGNTVFSGVTLISPAPGVRRVTLNQDIRINGLINMLAGQWDLNDHVITLGVDALINGESDSGRFIGPNGGTIRIRLPLDAPDQENPANLGIAITSAANLDSTTIIRGHLPQNVGSGSGIQRYFELIPTNNAGLNASLRLFYLDSELNGIPEAELTPWTNTGSGWLNKAPSGAGTAANYVDLASQDVLGKLTLAEGSACQILDAGLVVNPCTNGTYSFSLNVDAVGTSPTYFLDGDLTSGGLAYGETFGFPNQVGIQSFTIYDQGNPACNLPVIVNPPIGCEGDQYDCSEDELILGLEALTSGAYAAIQTLTSESTINTGTDVVFTAGQSITLKAGFHAQAGATFNARIEDCNPLNLAASLIPSESLSVPTIGHSEMKIYPNPTHYETSIAFTLAEAGSVSLDVFDLTGRPVKRLFINRQLDQGIYTEKLPTGEWASGMYLVVLRTEQELIKKQLVVLSN